jgi:hypothetical protein
MSDEHDSWFKDAFGVDLGEAAEKIKGQASAAVDQATADVKNVVQTIRGTVDGAIDGVTTAAAGAVKKAAGVAGFGGDSPNAGPAPEGGAGSFPLGGSVGRGGKNGAGDVRAVQAALGLPSDGQCGGQTIAAIEAFQRNMGQAKPDGRVDAGGATERALAGGAKPSAAAAPANAAPSEADDSGSFLDKAVQGAKDFVGDLSDLGGELLPDTPGAPDNPNDARDALTIGGLTLSLDNLSSDQVDAANRFLSAHGFVPTQVSGTGTVFDNYEPVFDGKPSSMDDVVQALNGEIQTRPLQNPTDGLKALAEARFKQMVLQAMKAADERLKRIVQDGAKVEPEVSRDDAKRDLTAFLQKVLVAQGGQDLRVSEPVRVAGQAIARGLSGSDIAIATLLQGKSLPGRPAELASAIARLLPPSVPRSNVEALDRIPIKEAANTQPQSLAALLGAVLSKDLERIIKVLPTSLQDTIRKGVADAVAAGVVAIVGRAMKDSPLDAKAKKEIEGIVEAAIKQKANEPPLDRKQGTEGSPDARDRPPSVLPPAPEAPDEQNFKTPEIDLPEGVPEDPKAGRSK